MFLTAGKNNKAPHFAVIGLKKQLAFIEDFFLSFAPLNFATFNVDKVAKLSWVFRASDTINLATAFLNIVKDLDSAGQTKSVELRSFHLF